MNSLSLVVTVVQTLAGRLRSARADDRGEINSNVAWAGLMLVVAVAVGAIVLTKATGAANSFDFGF